jgi:hypothetical protein
VNLQELAKPVVRALVAGGACLALIAPSAGARPITEPPARAAAATPAPQLQRVMRDDRGELGTPVRETAAPGSFDWVTAAILGAAFAGVLGLIWLAAASRTRVKELSNV